MVPSTECLVVEVLECDRRLEIVELDVHIVERFILETGRVIATTHGDALLQLGVQISVRLRLITKDKKGD